MIWFQSVENEKKKKKKKKKTCFYFVLYVRLGPKFFTVVLETKKSYRPAASWMKIYNWVGRMAAIVILREATNSSETSTHCIKMVVDRIETASNEQRVWNLEFYASIVTNGRLFSKKKKCPSFQFLWCD